MNGYELSRSWFDFSFENPHKVNPYHTSIFFFAVEHCNRLGWKKVFGFPTSMVLEAIGMKSYSSYKKYFDELVDFGFIKVHEYSKNQYSSNIIELMCDVKADVKALDKANIKHTSKHLQSTQESTRQSISSIIKQLNKEQLNNKQVNQLKEIINKYDNLSKKEEYVFLFEEFWKNYDKKIDKENCLKKWLNLKEDDIKKIFEHVKDYVASTPNKKYRKNPLSYLNSKSYENEIINQSSTIGSQKQTIYDRHKENYRKVEQSLRENNYFAQYDD